jgi:hypothetical protein
MLIVLMKRNLVYDEKKDKSFHFATLEVLHELIKDRRVL